MKSCIRIGTRHSQLALWQSNYIARLVQERYPECEVRLQKITTTGDKILDRSLAKIGGKGLFTKELEQELLDGTIDLAVHSLKDMPTQLPANLCMTAITARTSPYDVLVSKKYPHFAALPQGAVLGTSSLRRQAQLLAARPDLQLVNLRGNVDTRLRKLDEGHLDGIILAEAGLTRLGHADRIGEVLLPSLCLPAVGQGALALETRIDNTEIRQLLAFINDADTAYATTAERAFLGLVNGGCQVPMGIFGQVHGELLHVDAVIASLDGKKVIRDSIDGPKTDCQQLGLTLGRRMLDRGGREILAAIL
ncbi:MAG: hydroxymethylbilane synthase [Acidaminococcaceae bacterium]|nr:hydroxymethylbilane synthase [Acidaminococcaceae bacterium]